MKKNIKIAIFTDCFYPGNGGTENVILKLSNLLMRGGDSIKVYCPDYHRLNQDDCHLPIFRVPSIKLSANDQIALPQLLSRRKWKRI